MSIKITVDFTNGCYNVIGKYEGENYPVQKPVRGIDKIDDKTFQFRCSYNIKLMKEGKEEVLKAIKAIVRKYPNFRVSEKDLDQVDYLMYNFLKDWDKMNGYTTRFSIDYLMAITQEIEINNKSEISIEEFEKRCKDARANFLRKIGIEITYNVGLLEKSKKSVFWDEVEYILLANIQKKFIDAEVVNMVQHNLGSQELSFIDIEESEKDEELEQSNVSEDELVDEDDEKILDDDYYLDFDGEDELVDKISEKMKKKSEDRKIVRKIEASDGLRQKSEDIDKRVQKTKDILDKMSLELNEASKKIEQQNKDTDKMIEKNQNDLDIKIETLKAKLDAKSETLKSALNGEKVKINNTNGKSYSPEVAKATLEKINEELQAFINQNKKEEQSEGNKKEIKDIMQKVFGPFYYSQNIPLSLTGFNNNLINYKHLVY